MWLELVQQNSANSWIVFIGLTLVGLLGVALVRTVLMKRREAHSKEGEDLGLVTAGETLLARLARRTQTALVAAVLPTFTTRVLTLPGPVETWVERLGIICGVIQLGIWGTVVAEFVIERVVNPARKQQNETNTTGVIQFIVNLVVWSIVLLLGLQNLGVNVSAVLAGFGVGGIAVALATQTLLGDLIASISLVFDEPFKPGDFVVIGDQKGTVKNIGLRTTRIQALSGELLVLSNNDVQKSRIQNFRLLEERRIDFHFGVEYSTPSSTLRQIPDWIATIVASHDHARFDRCHFISFGDSDLRFEVVYFVLSPEYPVYLDIQQSINLQMVEKFEAEGVSFAFPTRTLHLVNENGGG